MQYRQDLEDLVDPGDLEDRWDQLDLTDPERPRLLCEVDDLAPLNDESYPR